MTKTFAIQWMNFNGTWRNTPGPVYSSRQAANKALKLLGLSGSPAYRIVEL